MSIGKWKRETESEEETCNHTLTKLAQLPSHNCLVLQRLTSAVIASPEIKSQYPSMRAKSKVFVPC